MSSVHVDQDPTLEWTRNLAWMRNQLARYTYRPGWLLDIQAGYTPYGPAVLDVRYPAIDSRTGEQGHFHARRPLQPHPWGSKPEEAFARDLQAILFDLERHESREWLRRDGVLFDDPHADPERWHCPCGGVGPVRTKPAWTCPGCGTEHHG